VLGLFVNERPVVKKTCCNLPIFPFRGATGLRKQHAPQQRVIAATVHETQQQVPGMRSAQPGNHKTAERMYWQQNY